MVTIGFEIAPKAVEICHQLLENVVHAGDYAIDATAGNGWDTLFLAGLVGDEGKVFAFDIQPEAIEGTKKRLDNAGLLHRVELIQAGHEDMDTYVRIAVKAVVFNLGYLPGGKKEIVTTPYSTEKGMEKSLQALAPGGIVCAVVYWGHKGGPEEKAMIEKFSANLSPHEWDVLNLSFPNRDTAPFIIAFQKRLTEEE